MDLKDTIIKQLAAPVKRKGTQDYMTDEEGNIVTSEAAIGMTIVQKALSGDLQAVAFCLNLQQQQRDPKTEAEDADRRRQQTEANRNEIRRTLEAIVHRIAGEDIVVRALIVPQDVHLADNQKGGVKCGDNGIFKGCAPTHEQKLLTAIAASIYEQHPSDGKYIIQGKGRLAAPEFDVTICQSHLSREQEPELREHLKNAYGIHLPVINPLGEWTGGIDVDCGCTNRKLGSDMGDGVTGGCSFRWGIMYEG